MVSPRFSENRIGAFGAQAGHKREAGQKPARSRHCMWSPSSRPTRRDTSGKGRAAAIRTISTIRPDRIHEPGDLPKADAFFSARTEIGLPASTAGTVPSFAPERGVFHVVRHGGVRFTGRARQRRHQRGRRRRARPGRAVARAPARRHGFRAGPAGGGRAVVVGLLVGPAHISVADVVGRAGAAARGQGRPTNWRETVVVERAAARACWSASSRRRARGRGRGVAGAVPEPARRAGRPRDLVGRVAGRRARDLLPRRRKAVWLLPRVRVRGRGARRAAGVRDRGAAGPRPRVHGDAAAGRRRADGAERVADDVRPVDLARQLQRRARGDVLAARRARGADLGSPAARRARRSWWATA